MIFIKSLFLLLLQYLAFTYGQTNLGHHNPPHHSLISDKAALLAFKKTITLDPNSTLANWDEAVDVCNFTRVTCNKQLHRVVLLQLNGTELVGLLSPVISNLTGLRRLVLVDNHLFGSIPPEFSSLRRLRHLRLEGNNLHGSIPDSLALLSKLKLLHIKRNNISGTLPPTLFSNCTLLENIDFSENSLTGIIPDEIGNCPFLWNVNLYNNQFTGQLPLSLTNASLYSLDVEYNHFSGDLPSEFVRKQPSLQSLHLSYNWMKSHDDNTNLDPFFTALRNCTGLEELELAGMGLGGRLPISVGQLPVSLLVIDLQENQIFGSIPPNLGKLSNLISSCIALRLLNLSDNSLEGHLPETMGELLNLEVLDVSGNNLSGMIPVSLSKIQTLAYLNLSFNNFEGMIPTGGIFDSVTNMSFLENRRLCRTVSSRVASFPICRRKRPWLHSPLKDLSPEVKKMKEVAVGELIELGILCTQESSSTRPTMLDAADDLDRLKRYLTGDTTATFASSLGISSSTFDDD
ncbi:hypothetical protein FH972_001863 [Carpinus fangiana]|uniref:Leucine-rich repeat-containing N-terminal plant-type domain-containing protein n=1 Tax=Carpinus fangiana TaxID=176857 RepID=A0A5N6QEX4_9ROSI|nr:hypothetical protein FH972_001863 [Carpinus fangiana]